MSPQCNTNAIVSYTAYLVDCVFDACLIKREFNLKFWICSIQLNSMLISSQSNGKVLFHRSFPVRGVFFSVYFPMEVIIIGLILCLWLYVVSLNFSEVVNGWCSSYDSNKNYSTRSFDDFSVFSIVDRRCEEISQLFSELCWEMDGPDEGSYFFFAFTKYPLTPLFITLKLLNYVCYLKVLL